MTDANTSQGAVALPGGDAVLAEHRDHVLLVTINRPEVHNAINRDVTAGLGAALEHAENDDSIWVVVVTGAGDRAFCAGADLRALAAGDLTDAGPAAWGFAGYVKHTISKPTIAAVNGFALGGGLEIALASDLIVAAHTATFGLPEVTHGVMAGAGGAFRLPQQLPPKIATELLLTGARFSAERAYQLGLVNRLALADEVVTAAIALADEICANAPLAVQATKRTAGGITEAGVASDAAHWQQSESELTQLMLTDDAREGMVAFAEHRDPLWRSR